MTRKGAGYSGSCQTCRRRKVKCDERYPNCERCEKGNRPCEGYIRNHRFVDENPRIERRVWKKIVHCKTTNDSPKSGTPTSLEVIKCPNSDASTYRTLGLSGFEENIHVSFLLANLMSGIPSPSPWLKLHAQDPSPCSQTSIRALGAVYFGAIYRVNNMSHGLDHYIKAVASLNHSLHDPARASSISVLKTAITLELFELIAFNSASGWLKHAGGVGRLIELRGPWRHQAIAERQLLEGNRVTIALYCLSEKRRCFLEHPDWKTIPWALDPESKTLGLQLHDMLCDMPGLVEDATKIQLSQTRLDQRISLRQKFSQNILAHLQDLYDWRVTWQQQNQGSCYEVPASTTEDQPIFSTSLYYSNLSAANEIAFYNAILLLLLRLGSQIIGPSFDNSLPSLHPSEILDYGPLYAPGSAPAAQAVATEICRSVRFHLLDPTSSAGAFFLLFPLRVAYQTFDTASMESRWLSVMAGHIADMSGFGISRNLCRK